MPANLCGLVRCLHGAIAGLQMIIIMKRLILSSAFVVIFIASVFPAIPAVPVPQKDRDCTVTATVKVGVATVTISATRATCEEAAADVKAGIRKLLNKK